MKVAHLDSPMMGQQKCECSVVDLKSCWRREQEVWALSSGRFTRRDDLSFDQCLSIQDGRSLVLLVAILGLPLVLEPQIQGPTVWANHHATQARRSSHHCRSDHCRNDHCKSQPHRSKVMPTLRMLARMLLSSQTFKPRSEMTM